MSDNEKDGLPSASYASAYWAHHQRLAGEDEILTDLALEKLSFNCSPLLMGACFFCEEDSGKTQEIFSDHEFDFTSGHSPPPILSASFLGLQFVVRRLLHASPHLANSIWIAWKAYPTPLQAACCQGSSDVITMLIEAGADVNLSAGIQGTALGVASGAGPLSAVRVILENNANVNVPVSAGRFKGWTPLYLAIFRNDHLIVSLLLKHGADPRSGGSDWRFTPLHLAAGRDSFALVRSLVSAGGHLWRPCPVASMIRWVRLDLKSFTGAEVEVSAFEILIHRIYLEDLEVGSPAVCRQHCFLISLEITAVPWPL